MIGALVALLVVTAWQYRKNKPLLLVIIGALFACAALFSTRWENISDWPLRAFALCWLICTLAGGVLAANKLVLVIAIRKKEKGVEPHNSKVRQI
jgi:multisubunit Na+/H+ antiporter MnhE subunit